MKIRVLLLIALFSYHCANAQAVKMPYEEDALVTSIACEIGENEFGYCLPIARCHQIMSSIRRFKTLKTCFFRRNVRYGCCPIRRRRQWRPHYSQKIPAIRTIQATPTRLHTIPSRQPNPVSSLPRVSLNAHGCGNRNFIKNRVKRMPDRSQIQFFILLGTEAKKYTWPWMAAIRVKTFDNNTGFLCGGSLITSRHVLTSAHCFQGQMRKPRELSDYKIILGSHYRMSDTSNDEPEEEGIVIVTPLSIKLHENFDNLTHNNDIAVVTLNIDVPITDRVSPVCLPNRTKPEELKYTVVIGWGDTSYGGVGSKTLQEAPLAVLPTNHCRRRFRNISAITITDNMLCAGDIFGRRDSCQHDSGGPLMCRKLHQWTQVGIVSFGYRCGERKFPGIYTRVESFVPWIEKQISN